MLLVTLCQSCELAALVYILLEEGVVFLVMELSLPFPKALHLGKSKDHPSQYSMDVWQPVCMI